MQVFYFNFRFVCISLALISYCRHLCLVYCTYILLARTPLLKHTTVMSHRNQLHSSSCSISLRDSYIFYIDVSQKIKNISLDIHTYVNIYYLTSSQLSLQQYKLIRFVANTCTDARPTSSANFKCNACITLKIVMHAVPWYLIVNFHYKPIYVRV